jgi:plastocyanin
MGIEHITGESQRLEYAAAGRDVDGAHALVAIRPLPTRRMGIFAALIFAGVAAAACGGGTGPEGPLPGPGGGPVGSITAGPGIQFVSAHNGSTNPAVDTIPAGSTVTWTWSGGLPHDIRSVGSPTFANSGVNTSPAKHTATFATPGTYRYTCGVHGAAMSGTLIVQ